MGQVECGRTSFELVSQLVVMWVVVEDVLKAEVPAVDSMVEKFRKLHAPQ